MLKTNLDAPRKHERLARRLAVDIVSGRLAEGEVIPSAERLAADFDVSRTVARETLQALGAAKLINIKHGKRTVVSPVQEWKFLDDLVQEAVGEGQVGGVLATDLLETRMALELSATRWCAERATDEQLQQILDLAEAGLAQTAGERPAVERLIGADLAFHGLIAEGAGNHVVAQLVMNLRRKLVTTWAVERLTAGELHKVAEEHLAVARALSRRDATEAERVMRAHFHWSVDTTLKRALPAREHAAVDRRLFGGTT